MALMVLDFGRVTNLTWPDLVSIHVPATLRVGTFGRDVRAVISPSSKLFSAYFAIFEAFSLIMPSRKGPQSGAPASKAEPVDAGAALEGLSLEFDVPNSAWRLRYTRTGHWAVCSA